MKKVQFILYILTSICFCSCEKDSDVKLPKVEEKLVLICAIAPQDYITTVDVSLSQPIFNTSPTSDQHVVVSDATVIISSSIGSWTLPYDPGIRKYKIDSTQLKIRAGVTYDLSVSTPEGRFARAFTKVPYMNKTLSCTVKKNSAKTNDLTVHSQWQDPEASTDYYRFEVFNTNGGHYLTYRFNVLKDEENPGGIIKNDIDLYYNASSNDSLNAILFTLSPEFYNYYDHLNKVNNSGGPFSEPIPMYTNVEGGFGVFGSSNSYEIKVLP